MIDDCAVKADIKQASRRFTTKKRAHDQSAIVLYYPWAIYP